MTPLARAGIVLLLVILATAFRLGLLAYSFYALIALLVLAQLLGRGSLSGVVHERVVSRTQVEVGETVNVSTEVRNASGWPVLWVLTEDALQESLPVEGNRLAAAFLGGGASRVLKYKVTFPHRGYYPLGPLVLESGDLFGLVRRFRTGSRLDFVTVLPRVVGIGGYDVPTKKPVGEVRVRTRIHEDPTRLAGVREYLQGDPLNRIHWKTTARTGRLHSKVYDPSTMIGTNLVVDFRREGYAAYELFERSELAITAAASLAAYILEHKQQVGLLTNGMDAVDRLAFELQEQESQSRSEARRLTELRVESDRLRPVEVPLRRGDFQLWQLRHVLARLELSDGLPLGELLLQEYPRLPRDAAVIVLAPEVPYSLATALGELKRSGFTIAAFVIAALPAWEQAAAALSVHNVPCYHLTDERQLAELAGIRF